MSLTIGQVARAADVNIETLRYYERRGLLPRPPRTVSNYRVYPDDAVGRVRFVKRAQELGFSLREISELLRLRATQSARAGQVREKVLRHVADLENRIRSLRAMKRTLEELARVCSGEGSVSDCPILEALDTDGTLAPKSHRRKETK